MTSTALSALVLVWTVTFTAAQTSCEGRCGDEYYRGSLCQCDYHCLSYGECCSNYESQCTTENSCKGRCGESFRRGRGCSCDSDCARFQQCCPDYGSQCEEDAAVTEATEETFSEGDVAGIYSQTFPTEDFSRHGAEEPGQVPDGTSGYGSADLVDPTGPTQNPTGSTEPPAASDGPVEATTQGPDTATPASTQAPSQRSPTSQLQMTSSPTDRTSERQELADPEDGTAPPAASIGTTALVPSAVDHTAIPEDTTANPGPSEATTGANLHELNVVTTLLPPTISQTQEGSTVNLSPTEATADLSPTEATADLSPTEATADLSPTEATADLSPTEATADLTPVPARATPPGPPSEPPKPAPSGPQSLNTDYQADDGETNLCSGRPVGAVTTLKNGTIVVFRGHYFWFLDRNRVPGPARPVTEVWGVPSPIDTAFTRCNCQGKTYILKGTRYWRFENAVLDTGYPKVIRTGFDGLRGHITAALSVPQHQTRTEAVYFFKRGGLVQKYSYQEGTSPTCGRKPAIYTVRSRKVRHAVSALGPTISIRTSWKGFPSTITAATSVPSSGQPDGYKYYVFSRANMLSVRMDKEHPVVGPNKSSPQNNFFKCPDKVL
ncbi:uncharacterized protein V6R79_004682 [Siganus canaliculatus]